MLNALAVKMLVQRSQIAYKKKFDSIILKWQLSMKFRTRKKTIRSGLDHKNHLSRDSDFRAYHYTLKKMCFKVRYIKGGRYDPFSFSV
jgi:hypothetical protein